MELVNFIVCTYSLLSYLICIYAEGQLLGNQSGNTENYKKSWIYFLNVIPILQREQPGLSGRNLT